MRTDEVLHRSMTPGIVGRPLCPSDRRLGAPARSLHGR